MMSSDARQVTDGPQGAQAGGFWCTCRLARDESSTSSINAD